MTATYTHTATKPHTGYRHRSNRLFGHTCAKPGAVHAANAHTKTRHGWSFRGFLSLCGEFVEARAENEFGDEVTSHVTPAGATPVTCKRCRKLIDAK